MQCWYKRWSTNHARYVHCHSPSLHMEPAPSPAAPGQRYLRPFESARCANRQVCHCTKPQEDTRGAQLPAVLCWLAQRWLWLLTYLALAVLHVAKLLLPGLCLGTLCHETP